jgi:hypothetical protein
MEMFEKKSIKFQLIFHHEISIIRKINKAPEMRLSLRF